MQIERCEYCHATDIVFHSEGSTCRKCCRLQPIPFYQAAREEICKLAKAEKYDKLTELDTLVGRNLISQEVAFASQELFQNIRRLNINFTASTLLVFVIHQSMVKYLGASYSMRQLSSLLAVGISPHTLTSQYARLWLKFPKLFKFSPFYPIHYIPLHMLFSSPKIRKVIFIRAHKLQKKSGYIIQLATCVFVVIQNRADLDFDCELLNFVCDFPEKKHICYAQSLSV